MVDNRKKRKKKNRKHILAILRIIALAGGVAAQCRRSHGRQDRAIRRAAFGVEGVTLKSRALQGAVDVAASVVGTGVSPTTVTLFIRRLPNTVSTNILIQD